MTRPTLPLLTSAMCLSAWGCGPATPTAVVAPVTIATSAPPATTSAPPPPVASPKPVLGLEAERRAILEELVSVDTSHGHEIDALRPVAQRLEDAGIHPEVFEFAPNGRGDLVARVRGNGTKKPLLLLAHIDVVPVEGQPWTMPTFHLTEKDGFLYGRGVNDDKGMAAAIVAIALELARTKATLSRDLIIALTAGEETDGVGIRWLLEHHRDLLDAELALNEGGSVVTSNDLSHIEGVSVGAAEKMFQSFKLVVHGPGGHSSIPPTDIDPVGILGRALERVAALRFPARALPPVKDQLAFLARGEKAPLADALRRVAVSAPTVAPADEKILAADRIYNALVRTTCVTTMLKASPQANVLPTTAEATVNCRLLPDDTAEAVKAALEHAIGDRAVEVSALPEPVRGPQSPLDETVLAAVRKSAQRWEGVIVFPSMGTGASDSIFLRNAGIRAYGLGTSPSSVEEGRKGRTAHGPDERAPAKWLDDGVRFLRDVVTELTR